MYADCLENNIAHDQVWKTCTFACHATVNNVMYTDLHYTHNAEPASAFSSVKNLMNAAVVEPGSTRVGPCHGQRWDTSIFIY